MTRSVIWFLPKLSVTRSNWIKGLEEHLKERQHLVMSVGSWLHAAIVLKIMLICHITFEPWKIEVNKNGCSTEAVISILLLNTVNQSQILSFLKIVIIHLILAQRGELITIKSRANITENQVEVLRREAEGLLNRKQSHYWNSYWNISHFNTCVSLSLSQTCGFLSLSVRHRLRKYWTI